MESTRLQEAVLWAAEAHEGQWRDGDTPLPYLTHPLEVLALLRFTGGVLDEDMLCAAVLHDTVEETDVTLTEIAKRMGEGTADLVRELTRLEPSDEQTNGMSKDEVWRLRADMLVEEVESMSPRAQTIKLCDRIANLRDARHAKKGKKLDRYVWQSWRFLDVIPRSVHPKLWDLLQEEVSSFGARK